MPKCWNGTWVSISPSWKRVERSREMDILVPEPKSTDEASLIGLWYEGEGKVRLRWRGTEGREWTESEAFRSFVYVTDWGEPPRGGKVENLRGEGELRRRIWHRDGEELARWVTAERKQRPVEWVTPLEHQYLLQSRQRLFRGMSFEQLRRCQLDIETDSSEPGRFSDPTRPGDRVLAIGLRQGGEERFLVLEEDSDAGEKQLLECLVEALEELDPDVIEGHNIFRFDLHYLRTRSRRHGVPCRWGREGALARFRNSRVRVAERWIDLPRCDLPGRTVFDTCIAVQFYDLTHRDMPSYRLKEAARYFGITGEGAESRTEIAGDAIAETFRSDRKKFLAYLGDDLRETAGLGDLLLPTYFAQCDLFPMFLQELCLRGTASKIDAFFLSIYHHEGHSLPEPSPGGHFEGGLSRSFQTGVFKQILHFDVASLYPSLLLVIGKRPAADRLGAFLPALRELRAYRLRYKERALQAEDEGERREAAARQAAFKVLINSFYGYLGFSGARFGDLELAAQVTERGRILLQTLIDLFSAEECTVIEADTDGLYLQSDVYFEKPEQLLAKVAKQLEVGIDLEFDGRYQAMFCYKAKNYALRDLDNRMVIKGSALRSRGVEPFLGDLTHHLVRWKLDLESVPPTAKIAEIRAELREQRLPVEAVARAEFISQNPGAYEEGVRRGKKPRRASLEVALQLDPRPKMGDRVRYFVGPGQPGARAEWQRAQPLEHFDPATCPYDPDYYLKRIDQWEERYRAFLPAASGEPFLPGFQNALDKDGTET